MVDGPISKDSAAINEFAIHWAENARVVGTDAVITHDEVAVLGDADRTKIAQVLVLRGDVRLLNRVAIDIDDALANFHLFARQTDDALDERFRTVERVPEDDDVATLDGLEAIDKFVDENALLIGEERGHAGALNFDG